jgi:hypothetical protein
MDEKQAETLQTKIKALLKKPVIKRTLRTFFQAFIGYISASLVVIVSTINNWDTTKEAFQLLFGSAVAAGLAAVMNRKELTTEEIKAQAIAENEATVSKNENVEPNGNGGDENA